MSKGTLALALGCVWSLVGLTSDDPMFDAAVIAFTCTALICQQIKEGQRHD